MIEHQSGIVVLSAGGDLDLATAPQLDARLRPLLGRGQLTVLDTAQIDFVDCSGLRVLMEARQLDPDFRLSRASRAVERLLGLLDLDFPRYAGESVASGVD